MDQAGVEGFELSRKVIRWSKPSKGMGGLRERKRTLGSKHLLNNQGNTAIFRAPNPAEMGNTHCAISIHLRLILFPLAT